MYIYIYVVVLALFTLSPRGSGTNGRRSLLSCTASVGERSTRENKNKNEN